ncbi:MAG: ATP-binding cassette domain-containing protein [Candidatus Aenigmatarchaeota archaeon]
METAIKVENLKKVFLAKQKEAGLKGSLKSIFNPKVFEIPAVNNVSFSVKKGEILGFIGPNGAGKSTTIKMLIGILYPSSGSISVLGSVPWKERQKLAFKIGSVFGQKPQLWYHLPPIDTFNLMSKIYELDEKEYRERLDYLVNVFEIDYLNTPVRKLSLGQRMRAEIVASLLHKPQVIFLDEPTIGLDIIAKQKIRDLIKYLNKKENVTVFLTSHDMDDVEKLCKRIIIVNHGQIVFDGDLEKLRKGYLMSKHVEVKFSRAPAAFGFAGAKILSRSKYGMTLRFDTGKGSISDLINHITKKFDVLDINVSDPPIEEIIAKIYRSE